MQAITPCIVFNEEAEQAVALYVSTFSAVFGNSEILKITRFGKEDLDALSDLPEDIRPGPVGSVRTIRFRLNGQELMAVNGGSYFGKFTESMSLYVHCHTQGQIDEMSAQLSEGGEVQSCGWVKDRYGVSWQIAPDFIWEIMEGPDPNRSQRLMKALYGMKKIDVEALKRA